MEKPVSIASGGFRLPVRARAEAGDGPPDRAIRQGPGGDRVLGSKTLDRARRVARCGIRGGRDRRFRLPINHDRTDITVEGMPCLGQAGSRIPTSTSSVRIMRRRWKFGCCGAGASLLPTRRTFPGWLWSMRRWRSVCSPEQTSSASGSRSGNEPGRATWVTIVGVLSGMHLQDVRPSQSRASRGLCAVPARRRRMGWFY